MKPNNPPELTVSVVEAKQYYEIVDTVYFAGSVTDEDDGDKVTVYWVLNGDICALNEMATDLSSGAAFAGNISLESLGLPAGEHVISFYAIDSVGSTSSDDRSFPIQLLAPSPTPALSLPPTVTGTIAHTPTKTQSPSKSSSPLLTPPATRTAFPYLIAQVNPQSSQFDYEFRILACLPDNPTQYYRLSDTYGIQGIVNFSRHSYANANVRSRRNDNDYLDAHCRITNRGVAIEAAAFIIFKVENYGSEPEPFHLATTAYTYMVEPGSWSSDGTGMQFWGFEDMTGFRYGNSPVFANLHLRNWPLVTDADTYWFGEMYGRVPGYWTMTSTNNYDYFQALVPYFSWSWQNRTIGPNSTMLLSSFQVFGAGSTPPVLDLSATQIPSVVFWEDELYLKGQLNDVDSAHGSLLLVYDNDTFEMRVHPQRVETNKAFTLPFRLNESNTRQGYHTLRVYGVDESGELSEPVSFSMECIAPTPPCSRTPTATSSISVSPSPTSSQSYRMSQTPSESPTPSSSPYGDIEMFVSSDVDSKTTFRLQGIRRLAPGEPIDISTRGFATRYSVNGTSGFLTRMQPVEVSGVQIATNIDTSLTTAVIQFLISNTLTVPQNVSIGLDTAVLLNGERYSLIYKQPDGTGFRVIGGLSHFQVFCRDYPMVTNVDSYWFGPFTSLESEYHHQVEYPVYADGDGAIALSWRDQQIPARSRTTLSVLMTWGEGADRPTVQLDNSTQQLPQKDEIISYDRNISIDGAIAISAGAAAEDIVIYLVVDGEVVGQVKPDSSGKFTISFTASSLRLAGGSHEFQVYAVDNAGAIAPIVAFTNFVEAPTEKQSETARASQSPTASATASASWGEIIDVPWYVGEVPEADEGGVSTITVGRIIIGVGMPVGVILIAGFAFLIHRYRVAVRVDMSRRLKSDSQTDPGSTGMGV
jgi:hypothetical protein